MRDVEIFRADGVDTAPVVIRIEHQLPATPYDDADHARKAYARFASEGSALAEAIWSACPGGTVDALLSALLARKASQFRVTFPKEPS